jgi:hypothetical protein
MIVDPHTSIEYGLSYTSRPWHLGCGNVTYYANVKLWQTSLVFHNKIDDTAKFTSQDVSWTTWLHQVFGSNTMYILCWNGGNHIQVSFCHRKTHILSWWHVAIWMVALCHSARNDALPCMASCHVYCTSYIYAGAYDTSSMPWQYIRGRGVLLLLNY